MVTILTILFGVLTALATFMTSTGGLTDGMNRGIKSITPKGLKVIGIFIALVLIPVFQNMINEDQQQKKETAAKQDQDTREANLRNAYSASVERMRKEYNDGTNEIKKSYDTSTENIFKALARYGLKYDSAQNVITKLVRDSSKVEVTVPDFSICDTGLYVYQVKSLEYNVRVRACNKSAPSRNINMRCFIVTRDIFGNWFYAGEVAFLAKDSELPVDGGATRVVGKINAKAMLRNVYMLMIGTYMDARKRNTFPLNHIYSYNLETKEFGGAGPQNNDVIRDLLRKNGVNN